MSPPLVTITPEKAQHNNLGLMHATQDAVVIVSVSSSVRPSVRLSVTLLHFVGHSSMPTLYLHKIRLSLVVVRQLKRRDMVLTKFQTTLNKNDR